MLTYQARLRRLAAPPFCFACRSQATALRPFVITLCSVVRRRRAVVNCSSCFRRRRGLNMFPGGESVRPLLLLQEMQTFLFTYIHTRNHVFRERQTAKPNFPPPFEAERVTASETFRARRQGWPPCLLQIVLRCPDITPRITCMVHTT